MKRPDNYHTLKGRLFGIFILVSVLLVVGIIHIFFGFAMLLDAIAIIPSLIYCIYTLAYGCLTLLFAYMLWVGRSLGWIGTVGVSLFIIIADSLTAFNLLTILGIPKLAAIGEIPFSILVIIYLIQHHVRSKYNF